MLYSVPIAIASYLMFSDNIPGGWLRSRIIPKNTLAQAIAIFLTAAGIAFALWARFYLGQNWSSVVSVKVGHELIRAGPYAWVRHPIYSGLLLALIGTALARDKVIGLSSPSVLAGILDQEPVRRTIHA